MDDGHARELERQTLEWKVRLQARLEAGDFACAIRAVEQVVGRLKRLARRHDDAIDRAFDLPLLWQMQENGALRPDDVVVVLARMYEWVGRLGAPADDVETPVDAGRPIPVVVPERVVAIHRLIDQAVLRCHAATGLPIQPLVDELVGGL